MGRYASDTGYFEQAPGGTHVARCIRLIDIGTQRGEYQGQPTIRNQVIVTWELPSEKMSDGQPFIVSKFYTNSLNEKANLRHDLETWRGRSFTQEELDKFDLQSILDKTCILTVVHNQKNKAVVNSVAKLMKGMDCPSAHNKVFSFWLDEFNQQVFDSMSNGIKAIIEKSDEYQARLKGAPETIEDDQPWKDEEEIPF